MKTKHYLTLLLLAILSTACVKIVKETVQNTTPPEFSTDREDLNSKISAIIPAEDILITSGNTKISGGEEFSFLAVEIVGPESFPSGGIDFSNLADEITGVVEREITNIGDYQKLMIEVRNTVEENDTEHTRTFKKEIDL